MTKNALGVIEDDNGRIDYLFRVGVKALIRNEKDEILLVREGGRSWDLPGGGIEHGETVKQALARELREEVCLSGDFEYNLLMTVDPFMIDRADIYLLLIIFEVKPQHMIFAKGVDADEIVFMSLDKITELGTQVDPSAVSLGYVTEAMRTLSLGSPKLQPTVAIKSTTTELQNLSRLLMTEKSYISMPVDKPEINDEMLLIVDNSVNYRVV